MGDPSDVELLNRWQAGDAQAGDRLVVRHFATVRAYFVNKVPGDHEDLVQETFVRITTHRERFQGKSSFRAFLLGVARMILLEYFRAKRRDARFDPLEHSVVDTEGGRMSSVMANQQSHRVLLLALRELPLADQELLELYYCQQLTAPELADLYGAPATTIRSRVAAALGRAHKLYVARTSSPSQQEATVLEGWLVEVGREWMLQGL